MEVKILKIKVLTIVLVFAASMVVAAVAPVLACPMISHKPKGVKIFYVTGGYSGEIDLPSNFSLNRAPWFADKMKINAWYIEGGNAYLGSDIVIVFHCSGLGGAWVPWARFITSVNPAAIDWIRQLTSGLPPEDPINSKSLPNDIAVRRHGNSITVSLKTPQPLVARVPFTVNFVMPPFELKLKKVGGLVYRETVDSFTGWPGASGWTRYAYEMGFNGNGAFTCADWGYNAEPVSGCFILMHGVITNVPP
jgi:hypothetical protein